MKRASLKKLLIAFSITMATSVGINYACSDGDWGWFGYSNFTPETFVDKSYAPLFYSSNEMFYGIGYDSNYTSRFNQQITSDWMTYLEDKLTQDQVDFFLLNDSSNIVVEELHQFITGKGSNANVLKYAARMDLKNKKVKAFMEFLYLAKQIENYSINSYDPWNYEPDTLKTVESPQVELIAQIQNRYQDTKEPFLKNRYWFQSIKAKFYSAEQDDLIEFFDKTESDQPKNELYYRALAYKAGANYKQANYALSNYQYSIVFDHCEPLRVVTAYNFHPQSEEDWTASLQLAKTADEKAALWALLGFYADAPRAIEQIYLLNPKNPHIHYLLTRVINIEENKLSSEISKTAASYKSQLRDTLNKNTIDLVNRIALEQKTTLPHLWYMAAGYLQSLSGNYTLAEEMYQKSEHLTPATTLAKNQLRLLRCINSVSTVEVINSQSETALLSQLNWLYKLPSDTTIQNLRSEAAITWSKNYLSALYKANNNTLFAELFKHENSYFQVPAQLEEMKQFLASPNKTLFQELAQSIYPISLAQVYDYQAISLTYENKIDLACQAMVQAQELSQVELFGNPFNGKIQDCHDCDHMAEQKTKYTKLKFLETLKTMQANIALGNDLYNNNLLLANAFYNMSYYGNARCFYQSELISSYDKYWIQRIYSNQEATLYYQSAFEVATTSEQKAKCSYMLAKCERNNYYTTTYTGYSEWGAPNPQADFLAWKGFVALRDEYANTNYYQNVINECGYFKTFIGANKEITH